MFKKLILFVLFVILIACLFAGPTHAIANGGNFGLNQPGDLRVSFNVAAFGALGFTSTPNAPTSDYETLSATTLNVATTNVVRGQTTTVSYVIKNTGDDPITSVQAGLRFFLNTLDPANELASNYILSTVNVGTLAPKTSTTVNFTVMVSPVAQTGIVILDANVIGVSSGNILDVLYGTAPTFYSAVIPTASWTVTGSGTSSINIGFINIANDPFGVPGTQILVPMTNVTSFNATATLNPTDIFITSTLAPGTNLRGVSFNVTTVSNTVTIPAFQTVVVTYNLYPLASAVSGDYTINVVSGNPIFTDVSGNLIADINGGTATTNATLDNVSPNLIAHTPAGTILYIAPTTNFSLRFVFDEIMKVSSSVVVSMNGTGNYPTLLGGTWLTTTTANDTFVLNAVTVTSGNEGFVTFSINSAADLAGNLMLPSTNVVQVAFDATAPTVNSITIASGATIVSASSGVPVTLSVIDNFSATTNLTMIISGNVSASTNVTINALIPFQQNMTLGFANPSGTKNITFTFYDQAGNSRVVTQSIYFDFIGLAFVSPSAGEALRQTYPVRVDTSVTATTINYYYQIGAGALTLIASNQNPLVTYNFNTLAITDTANVTLWGNVAIPGTGNITASVTNIIIDNTSPNVSITQYSGSNLVNGLNTQSGTATDNLSGVVRVMYQISNTTGNVIPLTQATGTLNWTLNWNVPTSDAVGTAYSFSVYAVDLAGNTSTLNSLTLLKSAAAPTVVVTTPSAYINRGTVPITGNVVSAFQLQSVDYSINGGPFIGTGVTGTLNFTIQLDTSGYADGTVLSLIVRGVTTVTPTAIVGTSNAFVMRVDDASPNALLTNLINGDTVAGTMNISGTASDFGTGSGLSAVLLSFDNGVTFVTANGTTNYTYTWVPTATMGATYNIVVQAVDNTYPTPNRQTPLTLTVNYNINALPIIGVVSPLNFSFVNNTLTISGTANALGGETISLIQISLDGGLTFVTASGTSSWVASLTVPTADPHMTTYNIVTRGLTSRGVFGVPSPSSTIQYFKDSIAPVATISSPYQGQLVSGTLPINVYVNSVGASPSAVAIFINGNNVGAASQSSVSGNISQWQLNYNFSSLSGSNHTIVARVTDTIANVGYSATVNVKTSATNTTTVPIPNGNTISWTTLATSPVYATSLNTIVFNNIDAASAYTVYIDGVYAPATVIAGPALQMNIPATETNHVINILSTNTVLGTSTASYQVIYYDVTPPTINVLVGGSPTLINGDIIAPNQLFSMSVVDSGSGFGAVPTFSALPITAPGNIGRRLQNGTASANQILANDSYNTSTYEYRTQIVPSVVPDTYYLSVDAIDNAGNRAVASFNVSALQVVTGANGSSGVIDKTKPVLNYPNPWNPNASSQVAISYYLTDGVSATNVYIYNQIGELIHVIQVSGAGQNGTKAGYNRLLWDGKDQFGTVLSNGIYLYSIVTKGDAGTSVVRGKMAVLRR